MNYANLTPTEKGLIGPLLKAHLGIHPKTPFSFKVNGFTRSFRCISLRVSWATQCVEIKFNEPEGKVPDIAWILSRPFFGDMITDIKTMPPRANMKRLKRTMVPEPPIPKTHIELID